MQRIIIALLVLLVNSSHAQNSERKFILPVEQSILLSTNIDLHYVEQGNKNGIPVILLHGYSDSWHSFESTLPYLPADLHVFALTQRGHGNSSKPLEGYHPDDFAADIAAFIKQKKIGPCIIVGHSMGGIIAQQFALEHPQLTKSMVIVASNQGFKGKTDIEEFSKAVSGLTDPVPYEFVNEFQKSTVFKPMDKNYYDRLVAEGLKLPAHVWKGVMSGFMSVDYSPLISKITQPTLLMWGDKDNYFTKSDQEVFLREIKGSRLITYEGTGHALHWEDPKIFASDLVAFINKDVIKK